MRRGIVPVEVTLVDTLGREAQGEIRLEVEQSQNADGVRTSRAGTIASVWMARAVLGPTLQPLCHPARCRAAARLARDLRLPSQQLLGGPFQHVVLGAIRECSPAA